jgi:hypothetical protein
MPDPHASRSVAVEEVAFQDCAQPSLGVAADADGPTGL